MAALLISVWNFSLIWQMKPRSVVPKALHQVTQLSPLLERNSNCQDISRVVRHHKSVPWSPKGPDQGSILSLRLWETWSQSAGRWQDSLDFKSSLLKTQSRREVLHSVHTSVPKGNEVLKGGSNRGTVSNEQMKGEVNISSAADAQHGHLRPDTTYLFLQET